MESHLGLEVLRSGGSVQTLQDPGWEFHMHRLLLFPQERRAGGGCLSQGRQNVSKEALTVFVFCLYLKQLVYPAWELSGDRKGDVEVAQSKHWG